MLLLTICPKRRTGNGNTCASASSPYKPESARLTNKGEELKVVLNPSQQVRCGCHATPNQACRPVRRVHTRALACTAPGQPVSRQVTEHSTSPLQDSKRHGRLLIFLSMPLVAQHTHDILLSLNFGKQPHAHMTRRPYFMASSISSRDRPCAPWQI